MQRLRRAAATLATYTYRAPSQVPKATGCMRLMYLNVNGLRAGLQKRNLLAYLATSQSDLVLLGEVKCTADEADEALRRAACPKAESWTVGGWNSSVRRKGYSGTGMLVSASMRVKDTLQVRSGMSWVTDGDGSEWTDGPDLGELEEVHKGFLDVPQKEEDMGGEGHVMREALDALALEDVEGRLLTVEMEEAYLINLYNVNVGRALDRLHMRVRFDARVRQYVERLRTGYRAAKAKPVLLAGDLNIAHGALDVFDVKGKKRAAGFTAWEREGLDRLLLHDGMRDVFRDRHPDTTGAFTYWSFRQRARERNRGWRLDYFLASPDLVERVNDVFIDDSRVLSDHAPVFCDIALGV